MKYKISLILFVILAMSFLVGCSKESELRNTAPKAIMQWMKNTDVVVSKVDIIGVSVDGNTGTVKAMLTCKGHGQNPNTYIFKKYDTGWVVERIEYAFPW